MPSSLKRRVVIGVTVIAAAAFAGGAYAQSQDSGANARQAFLNDVAKRLHVTPTQLSAAVQGAAIDQLNAAVASGRLTQAQAKALKQRITKGGTVPLPPGPGPAGPGFFPGRSFFGAPGPGPGGPGFFPGRRLFGAPGQPGAGPHFGARGAGALAAAASYLGLSERQLVAQLGAGRSLAQIATARGKSASGLKAAITASITATLDKAVAAKRITSAQEQEILSRLSSRLDDEINRTGPRFGFRAWGKGAHWRPAGAGPWRRPGASLGGPALGAPAPQAGASLGGPAVGAPAPQAGPIA